MVLSSQQHRILLHMASNCDNVQTEDGLWNPIYCSTPKNPDVSLYHRAVVLETTPIGTYMLVN